MTIHAYRLVQDTLYHSAAHYPEKVTLLCDQETLLLPHLEETLA